MERETEELHILSDEMDSIREDVKKNKNRKKRRVRGIVATIGVATALALTTYNLAGAFTFNYAMEREKSVQTLQKKADDKSAFKIELENPPIQENRSEWFKAVDKSVANIKSHDNLNLYAYEIENVTPTNKWIISLHGYRASSNAMKAYAYHFYEEGGYNVLLPDLRGCGVSEGDYIGMGYEDRLDVLGWINYLIEKDPTCQIVLHGVSMGGATVMMATGEDLPSNVKSAVEDCGYTSVWDEIGYLGSKGTGLPRGIINIALSAANIISKSKTGSSIKEMNSIEQLKKSETPTLFIHGTEDDFVPYYMLDEVYAANDNIDKEILRMEGATHGFAASQDPELYYSTMFDFIDNYWD